MFDKVIFDAYISEQIEVLEGFRSIEFGQFKSILIDLNELPNFDGPRMAEYEKEIPFLEELKDIKGGILYCFEIISPIENQTIIDKLYICNKESERHFPKIEKKRSVFNHKILYVGSVTSGIKNRIVYHLGYGTSPKTYSLQLVHWAKELKLQLKFSYCSFENIKLLKHVENAIWNHYKPLVGKNA